MNNILTLTKRPRKTRRGVTRRQSYCLADWMEKEHELVRVLTVRQREKFAESRLNFPVGHSTLLVAAKFLGIPLVKPRKPTQKDQLRVVIALALTEAPEGREVTRTYLNELANRYHVWSEHQSSATP